MYEITLNLPRRRVEFRIFTGLSVEGADELQNKIRAYALQIKEQSQYFDVFGDLSDCYVLGQEVASVGTVIMGWCATNGLRRSASVAGSALTTIQGKRINPYEQFQMFPTREEALAWLDSGH